MNISTHKQDLGNLSTKVLWQWGGKQLANLDWLSKSDPFARFHRFKDGKKVMFYETEYLDNNLNPHWKSWEMPLEKIF